MVVRPLQLIFLTLIVIGSSPLTCSPDQASSPPLITAFAVGGDHIYVGTSNGVLVALNGEGGLLWYRDLNSTICTISASPGLVAVGVSSPSGTPYLMVMNSSGQEVFRTYLNVLGLRGGAVDHVIVSDNGKFVVSSYIGLPGYPYGGVFEFSGNGTSLWNFTPSSPFIVQEIDVSDNGDVLLSAISGTGDSGYVGVFRPAVNSSPYGPVLLNSTRLRGIGISVRESFIPAKKLANGSLFGVLGIVYELQGAVPSFVSISGNGRWDVASLYLLPPYVRYPLAWVMDFSGSKIIWLKPVAPGGGYTSPTAYYLGEGEAGDLVSVNSSGYVYVDQNGSLVVYSPQGSQAWDYPTTSLGSSQVILPSPGLSYDTEVYGISLLALGNQVYIAGKNGILQLNGSRADLIPLPVEALSITGGKGGDVIVALTTYESLFLIGEGKVSNFTDVVLILEGLPQGAHWEVISGGLSYNRTGYVGVIPVTAGTFQVKVLGKNTEDLGEIRTSPGNYDFVTLSFSNVSVSNSSGYGGQSSSQGTAGSGGGEVGAVLVTVTLLGLLLIPLLLFLKRGKQK